MPPIAHLSDGPVSREIQRYHFGPAFEEPPVEIKFAKVGRQWTRIDDSTPTVPWDVVYQLASIRPIDTDDGDEVYAYQLHPREHIGYMGDDDE